MEKKLNGNYTRMLRAILDKSWRQHPTKQQLYSHLPPITKTIKVWRTRHAGHCWRSRDVLLWTPSHGRAKAGRPARTYIQKFCEDTGCRPEDLPEAMNNWEESRERVRDIRAGGTTRWWWYDIKYSYLIWIFARSFWLIDWTLTNTTNRSHCGLGSNGKEVLHPFQRSRTRASPLGAV